MARWPEPVRPGWHPFRDGEFLAARDRVADATRGLSMTELLSLSPEQVAKLASPPAARPPGDSKDSGRKT